MIIVVVLAKELSTFETVCTGTSYVYRTQVYIQNEILGYTPSPGDIAHPDKLEMMQVENIETQMTKKIAQSLKEQRVWTRTMMSFSKQYRAQIYRLYHRLYRQKMVMYHHRPIFMACGIQLFDEHLSVYQNYFV